MISGTDEQLGVHLLKHVSGNGSQPYCHQFAHVHFMQCDTTLWNLHNLQCEEVRIEWSILPL